MSIIELIRPLAEDGEHHDISQTHHWLLPETPEIIYGGAAFLIVLLLFWKFGVFKMLGKALAGRTSKIQDELTASASAKAAAQTEAADIRKAAGDIGAERERLLAAAAAQAEQLLADGRVRLDEEVVELNARAEAEIAGAASRSGDELQGDIARRAGAVADQLVVSSLDDATQQRLIEDFIAKVGASS